jgi:hypothetical protein
MSIEDFRTKNEILVIVKPGFRAAAGRPKERRGQAIPSKVRKRHLPRRTAPSGGITFYDMGQMRFGGGWGPSNTYFRENSGYFMVDLGGYFWSGSSLHATIGPTLDAEYKALLQQTFALGPPAQWKNIFRPVLKETGNRFSIKLSGIDLFNGPVWEIANYEPDVYPLSSQWVGRSIKLTQEQLDQAQRIDVTPSRAYEADYEVYYQYFTLSGEGIVVTTTFDPAAPPVPDFKLGLNDDVFITSILSSRAGSQLAGTLGTAFEFSAIANERIQLAPRRFDIPPADGWRFNTGPNNENDPAIHQECVANWPVATGGALFNIRTPTTSPPPAVSASAFPFQAPPVTHGDGRLPPNIRGYYYSRPIDNIATLKAVIVRGGVPYYVWG